MEQEFNEFSTFRVSDKSLKHEWSFNGVSMEFSLNGTGIQ